MHGNIFVICTVLLKYMIYFYFFNNNKNDIGNCLLQEKM